jgi:hypothetical protein
MTTFFILFFGLPMEILRIWGLLIYHWKVLKTPFQWCITCPNKIQIATAKQKTKIKTCSCLAIVDQSGQNNCNKKNACSSFLQCFFTTDSNE